MPDNKYGRAPNKWAMLTIQLKTSYYFIIERHSTMLYSGPSSPMGCRFQYGASVLSGFRGGMDCMSYFQLSKNELPNWISDFEYMHVGCKNSPSSINSARSETGLVIMLQKRRTNMHSDSFVKRLIHLHSLTRSRINS